MKTEKIKHDGVGHEIANNQSSVNGVAFCNVIRHTTYLQMKMAHWIPSIIGALIVTLSPIITIAQLPDLGTAINFGLFTSVGALGNTGVSTITGDIGTDEGAITGFEPPTVVNGNIELENNVTAQCAIDVQAAYADLFARTPTELGHAPAFGNGETLPAGVYYISGAGSIAGNLILDANGVPDTIFIFQFGGAFTTGASSIVTLINGASACNIFWIAEGEIAMAASTDMKGTLIANNGAISLGATGILSGRMLSTTGAASVYEVSLTVPTCPEIPLPITLLSFSGYCNQQNIVLQWSTATEINNEYFSIEKSENGINWFAAGIVAGAGHSSDPRQYSMTDLTRYAGTTYYRLKQTDYDGSYTYSSIISISPCERGGSDQYTIFPNPSEGNIRLRYEGQSSDIYSIEIFNSLGKRVHGPSVYQSTFDLSNNNAGIYFMRIQKHTEINYVKFILTPVQNN